MIAWAGRHARGLFIVVAIAFCYFLLNAAIEAARGNSGGALWYLAVLVPIVALEGSTQIRRHTRKRDRE